MLTKRALSAEWEKSSGSFSGGLLYAGGKISFSRFRSRFLGKERRLPKAVWAKKLMASGLPEPALKAAPDEVYASLILAENVSRRESVLAQAGWSTLTFQNRFLTSEQNAAHWIE